MKEKKLFNYFDSNIVPLEELGSVLRSNMDRVINFDYSSRRLITNKRGWRIASADKGVYQSSVMVAGCSWAEGVNENWENIYSSVIEKKFDINVANIGVSSYSLIQIVERIKKEIKTVKPSLIVISYLSGHINRCFKYNATSGLIHRPIYRVGKDKKYYKTNPVVMPVNTFNYIFSFINNKHLTILQKSILFFSQKVMLLLEGVYFNKYVTNKYNSPLDGEEISDLKIRENILKLFFMNLNKICIDNNCKVLLCGMPDRKGKRDSVKLICNMDDKLITSILSKNNSYFDNFRYIESAEFMSKIDRHVKDDMYFGSVWARDNNHPNGTGYKIIGEVMSEKLKYLLSNKYWTL